MAKKIGSILKECRIKAGISVEQISSILIQKGYKASPKTIYSWENGGSNPTPDALLEMCDVYKVENILSTFGYNGYRDDGSLQLNLQETEMIEKYRFLNPDGQETVRKVLDREVKQQQAIETRDEEIKQLKAQMETVEAKAEMAQDTEMHRYPYLHRIACAGTGFLFDDIPTDTIRVPYMHGSDFVIGVNGDSMEPTYYDGDLLYIKKTDTLKIGDIGIFTIRNECYVKEFGENELISHNKKYNDIPGNEDIRIVGKVIGKVPESYV